MSRGTATKPSIAAPLQLSRLPWPPPPNTPSLSSPSSTLFVLLRREQVILSSLHHSKVVSYLDFNVVTEAPHDQVFYHLFLEYTLEGSLLDYIKKHNDYLEKAMVWSYMCTSFMFLLTSVANLVDIYLLSEDSMQGKVHVGRFVTNRLFVGEMIDLPFI